MKIRNYFLMLGAATALACAQPSMASDIYIGRRGPTTTQLDTRLSFSRNEKGVETSTIQPIVKYWNGDQSGVWAFANVPYSFVHSSTTKRGICDMTFGGGPRGRTGPFHWLSYGAVTTPTAEIGGSDRFDTRFGFYTTTLLDECFNVNSSAEYNFTGRNRQGVNPPNELSVGCVAGASLSKKLMAGAGLTALRKENGDNRENVRLIGRYNFSPDFHLVLIGDKTISKRNIPGTKGATLIGRYNF